METRRKNGCNILYVGIQFFDSWEFFFIYFFFFCGRGLGDV